MTTVAILPMYDASGNKSYRAVAGDKQSIGKTAGQALDALTAELGENEFSALLLLQSFHPDQFFGVEQQQRLSELMDMWRTARDEGRSLSEQMQTELDNLVETEIIAATNRSASLLQQINQ
ncbi:MAG: hypothetical protein SAK29_18350 [Scytonema sp. PMC 1069.18]|nr:hypothetical protein [Scytonema sp. PMC 1069.18]MEC4880437.1 hypothetical protein [Scytonema sp. PMC 1070.18]